MRQGELHEVGPLIEVLSTVNRLTGFIDAFEPWYVKYARARPLEKTFLAGILGYGCFSGIGKIARISKWINETELETTVNGYFTLDNLHAANDLILKFMDRLELPEIYRRQAGKMHTSSDGQKYGVAVESLNANYSFKYLGQDAGVSAYTFGTFFVFVFVWIGMAQPPGMSLRMAPVAVLFYVLPGAVGDVMTAGAVSSVPLVIPICVLVGETIAPIMRKTPRPVEAKSPISYYPEEAALMRLLQKLDRSAGEEF